MKLNTIFAAAMLCLLVGGSAWAITYKNDAGFVVDVAPGFSTMANPMSPGTKAVATTDTSTNLVTAYNASGSSVDITKIKEVLITNSGDNTVNLAIGATATTSIGHPLAPGASARFTGNAYVNAINIVSAVSGSPTTLQITFAQ